MNEVIFAVCPEKATPKAEEKLGKTFQAGQGRVNRGRRAGEAEKWGSYLNLCV